MRTLLIVPGLFGTELHDAELGFVWGKMRCLYGGPPIATLAGLRGKPGRVMPGIPLVAGLRYNIIGALEGALRAAGYRAGETLQHFAYDWRLRVVTIGAGLAAEVRRVAEQSGGPIDLLGLSNGGMIIRAAFTADRTLPVERVVTSGSPHAGTLETLACIHAGFQFAPLGRTVSPEEFIACPGAIDAIPSPSTPAFIDPAYDLYDVETWRRLRLSVFRHNPDDPTWVEVMTTRLRDARETWRALEEAAAPRHLTCVCGTGLPTQVRVPVRNGVALVPGEGRVSRLPPEALTTDGDGALSVACASAWTGANAHVIRIPVGRHRDTVRAKPAFAAILEGLR